MKLWLFSISVILLFFPRELIYAIPPPDLILSISQSVLSTLGIVVASLIIALGSVRIYFKRLMLTRAGRYGMYGGSAVVSILLLVVIALWINDIRLNAWRYQVDAEIRDIWEIYEPIYSAKDEKEARKTLESPALEITWDDFSETVGDKDYIVIDIRDKHAFEAGRIEGSIHIRLADLIRGRWHELESEKDTPIFLVCYLGSTGALAGEFLASKGFTELYQPLEGLRPTIQRDKNLPFEGSANVKSFFDIVDRVSLSSAKSAITSGTQTIDLRSPKKYNDKTPITPNIQMFREFMTIPEIDEFLDELPSEDSYLFLCNSDASCYQGEMLMLDFFEAGLTAEGVYDINHPDGKNFIRPDNYFFE